MPEDKFNEEKIRKMVLEEIGKYMQSSGFISRKLTDTPTDNFSMINRRFVTLSSNLGARPVSSVAVVGQRFFDTTNNVPIWYTTGGWRNSSGSVVAIAN